jgi:hypothetical protein
MHAGAYGMRRVDAVKPAWHRVSVMPYTFASMHRIVP